MGRRRIKITAAVLCGLAFVLLFCGIAAAKHRNVAIINSYHNGLKWVREHNEVLLRGLSSRAHVSIYYIDFKRVSEQQAKKNVEAIKKACRANRPEVVVLTDDFAVKEFARYFVAKKIPVVFLGVNGNIRSYIDNVHKITGVFERPLVKRSITHLHSIMGSRLKRCLVAMDDSLSSKSFIKETMKGKLSFNLSSVQTDIRLLKDFNAWKDAVINAKKNGYDALVIGTYHIFKDAEGRHIESTDVLKWTSKHSTVPLFALWDFAVGEKMAVGGYVISGIDQGREALKIVHRILNGDKPEDINPVIGKRGKLLFSQPEMDRWNIKLPYEFTSRGYLIRVIR